MAKKEEVKERIDRIYAQAEKEIDEKMQDFWQRHAIRDQMYQQKVKDGKMDIEDYKAWLQGQVFQGKQWDDKKKQIARIMLNADQTAQRIVNGEKLDVFAANANYTSYQLEHGAKIDMGFDLYDSSTVSRLLDLEPDLLRALSPKKIAEGKAIPYYQKTVTNSVIQGIIQGEGVKKIAKRITDTCPDRGKSAAMRDARTAYVGAQNAGRIAAMRQAQERGIKLKKRWRCTLDDKTRDTHRDLDGVTVDVDDYFITSHGNRILYPADPSAADEEVYNCRCNLEYVHPEYPFENYERRDNETGENVGDMTYREWEQWKAEQNKETEPQIDITIEPIVSEQDETNQNRPDIHERGINENAKSEEPEKPNEINDNSLASRLAQEILSPYANDFDYTREDEYLQSIRAWEGEKTRYLSNVHNNSEVNWLNSKRAYGGEPYCDGARIDNTIARLFESHPPFDRNMKFILCDYSRAYKYLPKGENDRRLVRDEYEYPTGQVFRNGDDNYVIAFDRSRMNATLKESLDKRNELLAEGRDLEAVFPIDSPETVAIHEWGHIMNQYNSKALIYNDKDAAKLYEWYETLSKEDIKHGLSDYASTNFNEFQAECFAELQTPNPRPMAIKWWEYMEKVVSRGPEYAERLSRIQ